MVSSKARPAAPLHVEFLCGEDMLAGPAAAISDVLRMCNGLAEMRGQRVAPLAWQWRTPQGRAARRGDACGPTARLPEVLVLPGWAARNGPHLSRLVARDRAACERLRAVHAAGGHLLALYTGVALLGESGLLDERGAVVPWPFIPALQRHAPRIRLVEGEAWVEAERLWTADSPALATELMLRVLRACGLGDPVESVRAVLLHAPERQRLARAIAQDSPTRTSAGMLERARRWLETHWHLPFSLGDAARAADTSERSLLRHFRLAFGHTPLQHVHQLRVTHAKVLLETTYLPLEAVAERCGWRDVATLRTIFSRHTGLSPTRYRERHRLRATRKRWGQELG